MSHIVEDVNLEQIESLIGRKMRPMEREGWGKVLTAEVHVEAVMDGNKVVYDTLIFTDGDLYMGKHGEYMAFHLRQVSSRIFRFADINQDTYYLVIVSPGNYIIEKGIYPDEYLWTS